MNNVETLVDVLTLCIPQLDRVPLLADRPADTSQVDEVLQWMYRHLEHQRLIAYEEWTEYFGELPSLRLLFGLDLSAYDSTFVVGLTNQIDLENVREDVAWMLQYELPYLEYINSFLRNHGLRLVDLLPFENAYILCVKNDADLLERLGICLEQFGMNINLRPALDAGQVKARIEALLAS